MRPIIQDLMQKFSGADVFIVGGGASLKSFDFGLLKGKNVIALNSAYKYVDETAVLYWADASFGQTENELGLADHPSKYKFSSRLNADTLILADQKGVAGCNWLKKTGDYGFDSNVNNVRGNNSGAHAINFAVNLGAYRIILLGFDMGYTGSKSHFHDHHQAPTAFATYAELFIPSIESMAAAIRHIPVTIINCSSTTKLKCFAIGDYKDYL